MKKIFIFFAVLFSLFATSYSLFANTAKAVCPVCTVAVVGGLGISRWLGIDDSISGIWVGGLMISLSFWFADWLTKKDFKLLQKIDKKTKVLLSFILWVILTYPPLFWTDIIGNPENTILGIDKLIFGSFVGIIFFLLGMLADWKVRKIKGHQLFQFQKIAFPVAALLIASLVLYFFGGHLYKLK